MKVNILKLSDAFYPQPLKHIDQPPIQLYYAGATPSDWLDRPKVAIVGSRKASAYGREVTDRLASRLASSGVVIISGLALGIDSIAHQAAINSRGITVAVLPTALDKIYPAGHANLAKNIISSGGTLISEYSKVDPIYKANFTYRNRIISGLADAVLITEAADRSGSLNTARFALEQGRTVMAVPGNITSPGSEGTNRLIKAGALPVTTADDIFFALNVAPTDKANGVAFRGSSEEELILQIIAGGISDQEEIAVSAGLDAAKLSGLLIELELAGQIKPVGGGQWLKT